MAGIKISALPAVSAAQLSDIFPVVQAGETKKETVFQLTSLISSTLTTTFVPLAGGTMTGPLILSQDPTTAMMAATKEYVDLIGSGIVVLLATEAATTGNLNAIYANGAAGVGATLTNNGALAAFAVDGYNANLNDRILVKNQTSTFENGVYTVTTVGNGALAWVLTRATDYDQAPAEIFPGNLVPVINGTANATTSWLETATVTNIGVDPILFVQFTFGPSTFLVKGANLSDVANVAASLVNLGLGTPTGTGNVVLQTSPTLITPIATSLAFSPTTSGIIGTTLANNAAAGIVGEFITSVVLQGAAVNAPNGVVINVTTINLTPGDWDVWGNGFIIFPAQTGILAAIWISTTSATIPDASIVTEHFDAGAQIGNFGAPVGAQRISIAAPTTVYLSAFVSFATGTANVSGYISARRVR